MLFKCAHHAPETGTAGHRVAVAGSKVRSVDIHCHLHVPEVDTLVGDVFELKTEPLVGNTFENNGTWGIRIWAGAQPQLEENSTDRNGVGGLIQRTPLR